MDCMKEDAPKVTHKLGGFKKALGGVSVEAPEPHSGSFSGRLGSDSGVSPAVTLTLTLGPKPESCH